FFNCRLIIPSTGVPRAFCKARVVSLPHFPSTVILVPLFDLAGADFSTSCSGDGFGARYSAPFTAATNSSHRDNSLRGQFFPDHRLCGTTLLIGMLCSLINFRTSHTAFSTAFSKSPSLFSHISIPIDCVLPGPRPSPACHPCCVSLSDCQISLSSTV